MKRKERQKKFQAARNRKAERHSEWGRDQEKYVTSILEEMRTNAQISRYVAHKPNSYEDQHGKDFTVFFQNGGQEAECSFGITISMQRWNQYKNIGVKQFCFPLNTNKETIIKRILELQEEALVVVAP